MLSLMSASVIWSAWASVFAGDELHAGEAGVDHAVDGVGAAAADADDLDDCEIAACFHKSSVRTSSWSRAFSGARYERADSARYGDFLPDVKAREPRQDRLQTEKVSTRG